MASSLPGRMNPAAAALLGSSLCECPDTALLRECVQEPPDGYQAPAQHFSNLTQRWHSSSQLQGPKTSLLSKVRPPWGGSWVVCQVIIPGDFSAH